MREENARRRLGWKGCDEKNVSNEMEKWGHWTCIDDDNNNDYNDDEDVVKLMN